MLNIPDTTGPLPDDEYGAKIRFLQENVKRHRQGDSYLPIAITTWGLPLGQPIAGVQNGARQIECTINGIGERAGNTHWKKW